MGVAILTGYAVVLFTRSMMSGQSRLILWIWFVVMVLICMTAGYVITVLDTGTRPSLVATFCRSCRRPCCIRSPTG